MKKMKKLIVLVLALAIALSTIGMAASAEYYYGDIAYGAATTTASLLNIREGCGTHTNIVGTIPYNTRIVILECTEAGWYKINYNGTVGYCCTDYLTDVLTAENFNATGMFTGDEVCLRSQPNTDCEVLNYYWSGTEVDVIGINNGWYKIVDGDLVGYVRSDLMTIVGGADGASSDYDYEDSDDDSDDSYEDDGPSDPVGDVENNYDYVNDGSVASQVVELALSFVGYDYVYGGASPSEGFDCSGFVMYVYEQYGYYMPHGATSQYRTTGYVVSKADLLPGDLVFFSSDSSGITHVGLYIGNGDFVHAANSNSGVVISSLGSDYYTAVYYSAKRIVG